MYVPLYQYNKYVVPLLLTKKRIQGKNIFLQSVIFHSWFTLLFDVKKENGNVRYSSFKRDKKSCKKYYIFYYTIKKKKNAKTDAKEILAQEKLQKKSYTERVFFL